MMTNELLTREDLQQFRMQLLSELKEVVLNDLFIGSFYIFGIFSIVKAVVFFNAEVLPVSYQINKV